MSKLRVQSVAISLDGYGAGPNQDLQNPLGVRGPELMEWFFQTRVWRKMHGHDDGETGVDNAMAEQGDHVESLTPQEVKFSTDLAVARHQPQNFRLT